MSGSKKDLFAYRVGRRCKYFRSTFLKLSQQDICTITGVKPTTLSAFECGRDKNLKFIYLYYTLAKHVDLGETFLEIVFRTTHYELTDIEIGRGDK